MGSLLNDLRYAIRVLAKSPGISLIIVLSMGLSIGANTTVFTWMESFVLNPTPLTNCTVTSVAPRRSSDNGSWPVQVIRSSCGRAGSGSAPVGG